MYLLDYMCKNFKKLHIELLHVLFKSSADVTIRLLHKDYIAVLSYNINLVQC